MPKTKLKRVNKSFNPIILNNRVSVYYKMQRGLTPFPNGPSLLNPKALTHTQQNALIEYLKFYQSMLMIEIADYLKITRKTVSKRLKIIKKEVQQQLEDHGFGVWDIIFHNIMIFEKPQNRGEGMTILSGGVL